MLNGAEKILITTAYLLPLQTQKKGIGGLLQKKLIGRRAPQENSL